MKKIYLKMLLWLQLPEDDSKPEAYRIKIKLIDFLLEDDFLSVCNFLITFAKEIDDIFGSHTSEQLLQFVW